ncbi:cation diffusion facilitator family transporter [Nitrospira sp. Nam74]
MRDHVHDHTHGTIDPALLTTEQGIAAIKWSAVALVVTALIQAAVVLLSGSVALLADTLHNMADAASGLPLWLAFILARQSPTSRFTYGYGRAEDFAGLLIVLMIVGSGIVVAYESMRHLWDPATVQHLWAVGVASVIGFLGNEAVARYRLKVGHEMGSAALIADGHHARTDALSSLSVLAATLGVGLGIPVADPLVGLLIAAVILKIGWESGASIVMRMLDGVDPEVTGEVIHGIHHVLGVQDVTEVRIRWLGHRLLAEVNIGVDPSLSVEAGHNIAAEVQHQLLHQLRYLSNVVVHVDPLTASGEHHHRIPAHTHGEFPTHSH